MVALRALVLMLCFAFINAELQNVTCKFIREWVDGHNYRRLRIAKGQVPKQPASWKMPAMIWDDELAKKAASWAQKNKFQHNPDRTLPSKRFRTGENIYQYWITMNPKPRDITNVLKPETVMKAWFEEHLRYEYAPLTSAHFRSSNAIGHYTQMIWAKTIYLGCATFHEEDDGWQKYLAVCNYGPQGNMIGEKPYEAGRPSNKLVCGAGDCSRPYGDQCAVDSNYITEIV